MIEIKRVVNFKIEPSIWAKFTQLSYDKGASASAYIRKLIDEELNGPDRERVNDLNRRVDKFASVDARAKECSDVKSKPAKLGAAKRGLGASKIGKVGASAKNIRSGIKRK